MYCIVCVDDGGVDFHVIKICRTLERSKQVLIEMMIEGYLEEYESGCENFADQEDVFERLHMTPEQLKNMSEDEWRHFLIDQVVPIWKQDAVESLNCERFGDDLCRLDFSSGYYHVYQVPFDDL